MAIKSATERHEFKADYRVAWLSALGLLGFVVGCLILFGGDIFSKAKKTVFHEIAYSPRDIADSLLKHPINSLSREINERKILLATDGTASKPTLNKAAPDRETKMAEQESKMKQKKNQVTKKLSTDTLDILREQQDTDLRILKKLSGYSIATNDLSAADASDFDELNKALHFDITPDQFSAWQKRYDNQPTGWKDTVAVSFKDVEIPFPITGKTTFSVIEPGSDIAFITKYPATGTWLLLILIFTSFCFVAVSTSIVLSRRVIRLLQNNQINNANPWAYGLCVTVVTILLFFLARLWNWSFNDDEVIRDLLFMPSLDKAIGRITVIGYIAGGFCLAGFIYTAGSLGFIRDNIESIRQLEATTPASDEEKKRQAAIYLNLRKYFNTYFLLSSVILSLLVLCTGGLYAAVNSLDFVKLLADDWGYSPARSEFVYLYGGLHTLVLLLVYVPAKMRFNEIVIEGAENPSAEAKQNWYDFIKNPFDQFKGALVAVSPLLASVLQSLLDILFK